MGLIDHIDWPVIRGNVACGVSSFFLPRSVIRCLQGSSLYLGFVLVPQQEQLGLFDMVKKTFSAGTDLEHTPITI